MTNVRTLHPAVYLLEYYGPSASQWKDFFIGGEPNEVSVSMPTAKLGGNPSAVASRPAGGILL
jgi:hypothetical protein